MKAPLSWLREFVPIDMGVKELASRLALTGTEVERVTEVGVPGDPENLSRFVVGKVLECSAHPNASRLSVCVVEVGDAETRTIVCGAPNVAAGQTVAVILPGGVLADGTRIKEAKLRGVASAGMILSEAELGLATKSAGIMVLPEVWGAGENLADHFPLSDWVFEVEVTPNRPDCLSVRGLAREIAAITGAAFAEDVEFAHPWGDRTVDQDIAIEVRDPDLCPRYAVRVIRGVKIAESPLWLKARICHVGMRPISNVVDVTNYVQWALGQPLHAFDLHTIRGGRIIVRRAYKGETLVTLDNEERVLTEDMLVIADAERASVVAGIMGGIDSEITEATTDILLEGANFSGPSIMRTSAALGLRSEASTRYEKGLDREMVPLALDMACSLFVALCGGAVSVGTIDVRGEPRPQQVITLRTKRAKEILGRAVSRADATSLLSRLGCSVSEGNGDLLVAVPSFRGDLEREIDLIEEVARLDGLDRIPSTLPARSSGRGGLTPKQTLIRRVEDLLAGGGLSQVITYSFADDRWSERLRLSPDDSRRTGVALVNPLSSDQTVMRTMLLPGLLATAQRNVSVRQEQVPIFETGRVFHRSTGVLPHESTHVGILVCGAWDEVSWLGSAVGVDYYLVKGLVDRLCAGLHVSVTYTRSTEPYLHPGKSAALHGPDGQAIGWLGVLHRPVVEAYDITAPTVAAELDLDVLLAASPGRVGFRDLLAYPAVEQDLSLVVDAAIPAAAIVDCLRAAGGDLLEDVRIFDLYEGTQIAAGKKSLALRLSFRAGDRTLSEAEVSDLRVLMLQRVASELGAELRA